MFIYCKEDINLAYRNMDCKLPIDKVKTEQMKSVYCCGGKEIEISPDVAWILFMSS